MKIQILSSYLVENKEKKQRLKRINQINQPTNQLSKENNLIKSDKFQMDQMKDSVTNSVTLPVENYSNLKMILSTILSFIFRFGLK